MNDIDAVLAAAIRRQRKHMGLRQADLAQRLGWPLSRVTRAESGQCHIRAADLPALCQGLGLTLTTLLEDASPPHRRALGLTALHHEPTPGQPIRK